jgi:AcrR family transcriptional regulator
MRARNFAHTHRTCHHDRVTPRHPGSPGLREHKKQATREALREAALRLALERGPANVRVDDIADAAGVSPRTYNNYFSSRDQAIVAAITADRESRTAAAVAAQPPDVPLADAITTALIDQYTRPTDRSRETLLLLTTTPTLREAFLTTTAALEHPLAEAIAARLTTPTGPTAEVLAAAVSAATRIALRQWLHPATPTSGLVAVTGSLPDLLRAALAPLSPALNAA